MKTKKNNSIEIEMWYAVDSDLTGRFFLTEPERDYCGDHHFWISPHNDIEYFCAERIIKNMDLLPKITWENEPIKVKVKISF